MDQDTHHTAAAAARALEMIAAGNIVGLGTGRAASAFVHALAERIQNGLVVRGVSTSRATEELALELGIPLASLDDITAIDVTVDGADEIDPAGDLIKGYGGALVREKIVAAFSRRVVIVASAEKLVPVLGTRGVLPVEVVKFGLGPCQRRLADFGFPSLPRMNADKLFVSDGGNYILDCQISPLPDPGAVERLLRAIPGVVGTGLFLNLAHTILIQRGEAVEVRRGSAA